MANKTLHFYGQNLGEAVTFILVFSPPYPLEPDQWFGDVFPICWETVELASRGSSYVDVIYTGQTLFFAPSTDDGQGIIAGNARLCPIGNTCEAQSDGSTYFFTPSTDGDETYLECVNNSGQSLDIGVGFLNDDGTSFSRSVIWKQLANKDTIKDQFVSGITIYSNSTYKKSQIITAPLSPDDILTYINLNNLDE